MKAALFSVIVAMAARVACCFGNESTTSAQDRQPSGGGRRLTSGTKYINFIVYNDYWRLQSFGGPDGRKKMEQHTEETVQAAIRIYKNTEWLDVVEIKLTMIDQKVLLHKEYPFPPITKWGRTLYAKPEVWHVPNEKWPVAVDKDELINTFGKWADDQYDKKNVNRVNNWILMSGAWFSKKSEATIYNATIGYGTRSGLCVDDDSKNIVRCRSDDLAEDCAVTLAHELGHNLGMAHDNIGHPEEINRGPCLEKEENEKKWVKYVMGSHSSSGQHYETKFSLCSKLYLQNFLENHVKLAKNASNWFNFGARDVERCMLKAPPSQGSRIAFCGNGFVEPGEQCDCGEGGCKGLDKCCDETTCKFKQKSFQCSALDACCNEENCQLQQADTPCRNARGECDIAEVCNGHTSTCPEDGVLYAGTACTEPFAGVCYDGNCLSQEDLCANGNRTKGRGYVVSQNARDLNSQCGGLYCTEECDCGNQKNGDPCCECETCKLKDESKCSSLDSCCTETCDFKPSGTTCQEGQCTEQKTCTGTSGICPVRTEKAVGTDCIDDKGDSSTCYAGKCAKSWDSQCRDVNATFGKYVLSSVSCIILVCGDIYNSKIEPRNLLDGTKIGDDTICVDGKKMVIGSTKNCASDSFLDSGTFTCEKCFPTCKTCSGKGSFACSECKTGSKDSRGLCPLSDKGGNASLGEKAMSRSRNARQVQGSFDQGGPRKVKDEGKEGLDVWVIPVIISLCVCVVIAVAVGYFIGRRRSPERATWRALREPSTESSEDFEVALQASVPIGNLSELRKLSSRPAYNGDKYDRMVHELELMGLLSEK